MRYYAKGLPWASGIGTNVEGCQTTQEVMEKAGLNFSVSKCELVARMPFSINGNNEVSDTMGDFSHNGYIFRDCPNAYATYRTDKNIPLGLVKSKYEVVQNIDAFKFFDDAIGFDKANWQYAGAFGYGHKVFITAKLAMGSTVGGDPIDNYLVFSNSHDGSSSINILFTPIRVFCTNCLASAFESASSYIRIRHTKSAGDRLERGAEVLRIACEHAKTANELYNSLVKINMSDEEVTKYLADLCLSDEEQAALYQYDEKNGYKKLLNSDYLTMESTGISTRKVNIIRSMRDYYFSGVAQERILGTAWGAFNAVTGYYSNVANLQGEKRMDSLLYGNANTVIRRALHEAYAHAS